MVTAKRPKPATVKSLDAELKRAQDERYGKRPRRQTMQQLEWELADLRVSLQNTAGRLDVASAQRDALSASLAAVLDLDDPKQHRWPKEQQTLADARALVAELGRGKPDALREKAEQWAAGKERR